MLKKSLFSLLIALINLGLWTTPDLVLSQDKPRRMNVPFVADDVPWEQTAIFWFGKNEQTQPGKNYADVRVAYTSQGLKLRLTVVDYYLWYHQNPDTNTDLSQYEAVALYVDTAHDRAINPQTDDYRFLIGARHYQDISLYKRQAKGTGVNWDTTWTPNPLWPGLSNLSWNCNPGPNSNACGIDFGWTAYFTVPWDMVGLTGPSS